MTTLIEAARQALEALDICYGQQTIAAVKRANAVTALRQAIEQAQQSSAQRERWNIERDGDDLLVCFNQHDKSEGCKYVRFKLAEQAQMEDAPRGLIDIKRIFTSEAQKTATYVTHDELANYMDKIADAIAYNSHEQLNHLASQLRENT